MAIDDLGHVGRTRDRHRSIREQLQQPATVMAVSRARLDAEQIVDDLSRIPDPWIQVIVKQHALEERRRIPVRPVGDDPDAVGVDYRAADLGRRARHVIADARQPPLPVVHGPHPVVEDQYGLAVAA